MKTCILIAGPTAAGKTAIAIQLAKRLGTEIISADSRQCYLEMTIGVAKPEAQELNAVKHHFVNSHSVHEEVNAGTFERYALEKATKIFEQHDQLILAGGTGLYIKAFCEGIDLMPEIPAALKKQLNDQYEKEGITWLQQQVQQNDPVYYADGEILNPHRMLRALEVKMSSGKSIRDFQNQEKTSRNFRVIRIGVAPEKEELHRNIHIRVDQMMDKGLLAEVKNLYPLKQLKALQTVGYSELFQFLDGELSMDGAVEEIKKNTRHYAKRQMTWFRRDEKMQWFQPSQLGSIFNYVEQELNK